ncbi:TauD/TfdA dioxygenase family protein [Pseudomonas lactis]|uniref:TauD/TfdA dioxygenase family protein n=1 Tax=Pseudomonas lactis TaxID=1615674 RepID=UPI0037C89BE3
MCAPTRKTAVKRCSSARVSPPVSSSCPDDESRDLLGQLYAHSVLPENIYRHQWQPHDLVFWDNRSLIHLAAGCPSHLRRKLFRTTIQGDAPF